MTDNQEIKNQNMIDYYQGELINCEMCKQKEQIGINSFSCSHSICFNCIYKFFLSSGLKGLDIENVKIICPLCKNGEKELSLEEFSQYLKILTSTKNEIKFQIEQNNRNLNEMKEENCCKTHNDRKLIKFCNNCNMNLCDKCINEIHAKFYQNHVLVDLPQESNNNIKKQQNNDVNEKANIIYETMQKNEELKDLLNNQNSFLQKFESEKIKFNIEIDKLINDLKSIKDNYAKKYFAFQNNIEKIFEIINLTYLNYHISPEEEKNQISITKNLLDINYISKKFDFSEVNNHLQKTLNQIMYETNIFSYEFQWSTFEYKKAFKLTSQEEDKGEDCITKIIELADLNQIVAGLIGGQICVWNY